MYPQITAMQRTALAAELRTRVRLLETQVSSEQQDLPRVEYAQAETEQDADDLVQRDGDYEVEAVLSDIERQELVALHNALRRVEDHAYGLCVACGQAIPFDRLKIKPEALRCRDCEALSERNI
jgi:DnaK suppressor protein